MSIETKTNTNANTTTATAPVEEVQGLDDPQTTIITLIPSDHTKTNRKFEIDLNYALISKMIGASVEQDKAAKEIDVPSVNTRILGHVVEYMAMHKGKDADPPAKPLKSRNMGDVCSAEDAAFIDKIGKDRQELYDLILAANYMDIQGLLHIGCAKVASLIKGQPLERIKDILDPTIARHEGEEEKKQ